VQRTDHASSYDWVTQRIALPSLRSRLLASARATGDNANHFLRMLEPLRDALYRFALRNVWSKDQAGDAVQEAVLVAWSQFDKFAQGTNFRAWMFRILLHTLYRLNRKFGRGRRGESVDGEALAAPPPGWASILENPQRVFEDLDERLTGAIAELGDTERQCLLLRLLEDFSYREIADMLDLPVGTVMSHVYRARLKLRAKLTDLAAEEGWAVSQADEAPVQPARPL
jgi:RNA polymerase sigma-70 factor (ECF subfamily)